MSAFNIRKQSPNQGDKKSPSVAIKSRQQATHDINKRRTLLQDNSWIKKRPEEESADENYGRAVLNQYKSQESLHSSSTNEKEDQKAVLGRYRSDTTLDRIPAGSDTDKINQSPTLNHKQNNRQSWTPNAASTATAVTSPIKKKRQSWMPPPVSSSKTLTEKAESKRTTSENSEAPTTAAPSSEQVTPQKSETDVDDQATARNQDLNNLSKAIPSSLTSDKERKDLSDLTEKNTADQKNRRDEDLGDHTEVKSADDQSKKRIIEKSYENPPRAPNNLPEINYSRDSERKTSKSSLGAYEKNITGNTIKTVYSTSDRSIIGKDICTYCRKPLGIDAKMILDALQIHCHSTCFKCEVCKRPLEDLKAGDSIWIYQQTVHCEPCYSKVKEKWIF
ncbi:sciellin isoform X1 [Motacilla alba alba]|uniref:sciellin isoform X1 n=1 Tax=Motacilla alba alba TaxID=1094192 RepID=UPI0018D55450|nr:sciellin isoform X1 [Motacilla alba alba]XP_038004585.1 sciellin isoform X1 [Motacilla alba alba]XP_038004595.1 sciellin isoform X1 [Motacilla alba alba]